MARLSADQRDYKEAFKKHYHAFTNWGDTGSLISKNMILTYCVECGIKYLVMRQEGIRSIDQARKDLYDDLSSHDFEKLLTKYLFITEYHFPVFTTIHRQVVRPSNFHQVCRYALCLSELNDPKHMEFLTVMEKISGWLNERVGGK